MSKTAIINSGRNFFIKQLSESKAIVLDQVIFANISGITGNTEINLNGAMPTASQIVHKADVTQAGLINERTVVYSVILDTSVGDFSFNYIGLVNSATNTLCMVMHTDLVNKIKTAGQQQGNTITESIWLEMDNASTSTGITVNAQTWQIDFSNRLAGEDERIRLTNLDLYGRYGVENGFAITKNATSYTVAAGISYIAGLRINHIAAKTISVSNGQSIYIDAWLEGTPTGAWDTKYNILAGTTIKDYLSNGTPHYCEKIALIDNAGVLTQVTGKKVLTTVDLDSSVTSSSESKAATSKAVKEAYDKANTANATAGNALSKTITTPQTVAGEVNFSSSLKSKGFEVLKVGDNGFGAERVSVCSVSFSSLSQMTNGARLFVRDSTATILPSDAYGYLIKNGVGLAQGEGSFIFVEHGNNGVTWKGFQTNYLSNVVWMKLLSSTDISNYLPTGIPQPWPTSTPPAGWLKCNGATFDKSLYPNLAIAYPAGKLPDLRGEFIRGLDDGRGVDVGRSILSSQGDAMRNFKGEFENNGHAGKWGEANYPTGPFTRIGLAHSNYNDANVGCRYLFDPSLVVPTADENRPRNIAFLYIVKAA